MEIVVEEARDEDMEQVFELEEKCFKYPYPPQLLAMLRALYPELFLVAKHGNRVVGYVSAVVRSDGYGHIVSICVDPEYRRQGIGKKLMESVEARMRSKFGLCRYRLEVRVSNEPAIRLYKSLGYRIVGVLRSYYPDGEDGYVMVKDVCQQGERSSCAQISSSSSSSEAG